MNLKVDSWPKVILRIAIMLIIFFMLLDFMDWRMALNDIEGEFPGGYSMLQAGGDEDGEVIEEFKYVPLVWRGRFSYLYIETYDPAQRAKEDQILKKLNLIGNWFGHNDTIEIKFKGYVSISIDLKGSNGFFYGTYNMSPKAKRSIKDKKDGWEKLNQPIGEYAKIYVKIQDNKVIVLILGTRKTYIRKFNTKVSSSPGSTTYRWGK